MVQYNSKNSFNSYSQKPYSNSNRNPKNDPKNPGRKTLVTIAIVALILGCIYLYNHRHQDFQVPDTEQGWEGMENSSQAHNGSESQENENDSSEGSYFYNSSHKNNKKKASKGLTDEKGNPIAAQKYWDVKIPSSIPTKTLDYSAMRISFNPKLHIPNWVAWELTGAETRGKLERSDNFMPDPNCPESAQLYDYKRSGYDRGHMCPAADARWDPQFMQEVFYMTNMCPQDHELNTGEWNNLEIKCRDWARTDSAIIIITGPVLTDKLTKTIGPSKVAVPERFFKVILSPYANPPRAIGFIMANRNNPGGMEQNALSIDQVEQITGYDFFSIINDKVEDQIESVNDFPYWSRLKRRSY